MIDVAKDKMSSKRFMPSLIDIPEELSHYSATYGSNQRLSHYAEELRRSGSFNTKPPFASVDEPDNAGQQQRNATGTSYATLKRTKKSDSLQRASRKAEGVDSSNNAVIKEGAINKMMENTDEVPYHPVELRANFLQKSPLPGRKCTGLSSETMNVASVYTNPSIEEIYRSLDRSQQIPNRSKGVAESGAESDAVSDLVSEAESKLPKITAPGTANRSQTKYFEPDSLDRNKPGAKPHLYQKKPPRWTKRAQQYQQPDTNDEMREADENSSSAAGYTSSTCTSMKSLSRVLPAEEAMEVGNQLFNMDTGAPTLPRLIKSGGRGHIYEKIGRNRDNQGGGGGLFVNKEFRKPTEIGYEVTSSNSSSSNSSKVTVVEDCLVNKLTIQVDDVVAPGQVEDAFEADTLERRDEDTAQAQHRRQDSFIADSLERPIQPVKKTISKLLNSSSLAPISPSSSSGLGSSGESLLNKEEWIKKEELPPPGSVVSLRQIYTARQTSKVGTWSTATLEAEKKPTSPNRIVSASNAQVLLRLAGQHGDPRLYQSLPAELPVSSPPPLPSKSVRTPSIAPVIPPRDLKPPIGVHQHPPVMKSPAPSASRGVQTDSTPPPPLPPIIPPKNGKGGSSGRATATSAGLGGGDEIYSGHFILSHPSPSGGGGAAIKLPNVLERIAQIEREESRISGASKGMEIAMSLKARMGHLEGSLKDHKKTLSIKKTWRKLLDKVEDSFSETESAGSTLRRPPSSSASKLLKKSLPPPPPSDEDDETDVDDDDDNDSRSSSLGSDGTGRDRHSIAGGGTSSGVDQSTDGIKLKSFYTFGEDGRLPSPVQQQQQQQQSIASTTIKSNSSGTGNGRRSAPTSVGGGVSAGSNLASRKLRTNDSYDSGLYSSNYSTYIGDY